MAGIGFKISKMLSRKTLTMDFLAFFYSALITVGPWIISSTAVWFMMKYMSKDAYFQAIMVYSFIFSVIITGGVNLTFTRRISDLTYAGRTDKVFPEFLSASFIVVLLLSSSAILFFIFNPHGIWLCLLSIWFFVSIGMTWFSSIVMAETRKLFAYTSGYLLLGTVGVLLSILLGERFGGRGGIAGFLIADIVCLILFTIFIGRTFGFKINPSFEWIKESVKYWELYPIGWIYYLSIWADDFIVWFSQYGYENPKGFRYSPVYDLPMFLAYLTIIPTMIMFVMVIETKFYKSYRNFYETLSKGASLSVIKSRHSAMMEELNHSLKMVMKIQFIFTIFFILLNEVEGLGLSGISRFILRTGLAGAMINGFFMMILLILLYFEFRREALFSVIVVFVANTTISFFTLKFLGFKSAGIGYTLSFFIGTITSYEMLKRRLKDLIRIEYLRQPLGIPRGYIKREKYGSISYSFQPKSKVQ